METKNYNVEKKIRKNCERSVNSEYAEMDHDDDRQSLKYLVEYKNLKVDNLNQLQFFNLILHVHKFHKVI